MSDLDSIIRSDIALLGEVFPESNAGIPEVYRWTYSEYPEGEPIISRIIENGEVIARTAILPQMLLSGSKRLRAGLCVGSAVSKTHRNVRLFFEVKSRAIDEAKRQEYDMLYSMSNESARGVVKRLFGFRQFQEFHPLIYFPRSLKTKKPVLLLPKLFWLFAGRRKFRFCRTSEVDRFEEMELDGKSFFGSAMELKPSYLEYRYFKCPVRNYTVLEAFNAGVYLIGRDLLIRGVDVFIVTDVILENPGSDLSAVVPFLVSAAEYLQKPLGYFHSSSDMCSLKEAGFRSVESFIDRKFEVLVLPLKDGISLEGLSFSFGNIDVA